MSKVLSNPFATQPVQVVEKKTLGDVITDMGSGMEKAFAGMEKALGWKPSKLLPLRPEYLTYEDDAFDLGWYSMNNGKLIRQAPASQVVPEDIFSKYGLMI